MLEQCVEREREKFAVPRKIPQPPDRVGIDIDIGQIHRRIDWSAIMQARIDRVILQKRQRAIGAEECLRAGQFQDLHLRKQGPHRAQPDDDQDEDRFADVFVEAQNLNNSLKRDRLFF